MDKWFPRIVLAVLAAIAVSPTVGGYLFRASFAVPLYWCHVLTWEQATAFAFLGMADER